MRYVLGLLAVTVGLATLQSVQARPINSAVSQITAPIDESKLVTLSGSTRPEATAENDRGQVSASLPLDHIEFLLRRPLEQQRQVEQLIADLHNPASPHFHKWLAAGEF